MIEPGQNVIEARKVRRLYRDLFNQSMPRGWSIWWGIKGITLQDGEYGPSIFLAQHTVIEDLATVVHELIHVRYPDMSHGVTFSQTVNQLTQKALKVTGAKGL